MTSPTPDVAATVAECLRPDGLLPVGIETVGRLATAVRHQAKALSEADSRYSMAVGSRKAWQHAVGVWQARSLAAEARLAEFKAEARKVIEPFALIAENDVGSDEADSDVYQPITHNRVSHISIGHLRAARSFLNAKEKA